MGWKLSDITQFSWSIIQTKWDPWISISLDEFWVTVFMTQWLKKMDESNEKWKQVSAIFKTQKLKLSGMSVNKMRLWAPKANALSHPSQALGYYRWSPSVPFQFSLKIFTKNFPSFHFPLSASSHFHFPLHPQRASSMAPQYVIEALNQAWEGHCMIEEQRVIEALNQTWIFTGESTELCHCVHTSLSLS